MKYSVIIRTFNSEATLPETLGSLDAQTVRPERLIFVDSGSSDGTLALLPESSVVHRYVGTEFNYADALNQGLPFVETEYVAIISSHTSLEHPASMAYALRVLRADERIGAAYFTFERTSELTHDLIDERSFNGFNGLWNTCSVIKSGLLRERRFRPTE